MTDGFEDLLRVLAISEVKPGLMEAPNLDVGYHRVFGGQILAQALLAAARCEPERTVGSLHVVFCREGDTASPMRYSPTLLHSGRTFATVGISAHQEPDPSRVIASAVVSLHSPAALTGGPRSGHPDTTQRALHRSDAPPPVGPPDRAVPADLHMIPWETRVVDGVDLGDRRAGPPRLEWWMRTPALGSRGEEPRIHQALLAHATDLTPIGTALRPFEGLSVADSAGALRTAVTSHTLWFHQPFRIDEWLLVTQHATVTTLGRSFARGEVHTADELVASFAQEAMVLRAE